ncbi:hypothetical protein DENSPDRAFT_926349 [Dentipellis sp. KUC8613]|nr:hypothetical protein DENSPDRAFT_926349 [Dentipellis sp. KUC8613]
MSDAAPYKHKRARRSPSQLAALGTRRESDDERRAACVHRALLTQRVRARCVAFNVPSPSLTEKSESDSRHHSALIANSSSESTEQPASASALQLQLTSPRERSPLGTQHRQQPQPRILPAVHIDSSHPTPLHLHHLPLWLLAPVPVSVPDTLKGLQRHFEFGPHCQCRPPIEPSARQIASGASTGSARCYALCRRIEQRRPRRPHSRWPQMLVLTCLDYASAGAGAGASAITVVSLGP